jgi:uridine kinase
MGRPLKDSAPVVLDLVRSRPATLGRGRLVAIDGPAGSGKSTLAAEVAALAGGAARVIHMDDLYAGWDGLSEVSRQLAGLLRPLAERLPGSYRRYDWHAEAFAETVTVEPTDLLVLEGVGSGCRMQDDLIGVLVWVEAPYELRMRRGIERDGEAFAQRWTAWAEAEEAVFAKHCTRQRADLVVDGSQAIR